MKKHTNETIVISALIFIVLLGLVLGSGRMMGSRYGYGMMGSFGGFYFFGWIFMLLIVVALVLFIFWLIDQLGRRK